MIVDLVIIGIIALFTFLGYKKGLMKVAFKLISLVLAIIIAIILHGPVSDFVIHNTGLYDQVKTVVSQNIDPQRFKETQKTENKEESATEKTWTNYLQKSIEETANNTKNSIEDVAVEKISSTIINVAILIIIFILVRIILSVLNLIIDILSKLPVLKQFDKVGGTLYGILEGVLVVYILLALCLIMASFIQETGIIQAINNSFIGKMLYENNILLKLIG